MKKILIAAFMSILASATIKAQTIVKNYSKTVAAGVSDTTGWLNMGSKLSSLTYTVTKDTGTVAGKIYLEVANMSSQYKKIDSFTLANTTIKQTLAYTPLKTYFLHYRFVLVPTGNWSSTIATGGIRRTDE